MVVAAVAAAAVVCEKVFGICVCISLRLLDETLLAEVN